MRNLRIILVCNNCSKIIAPIRSRCLLLRVPAPSNEDVFYFFILFLLFLFFSLFHFQIMTLTSLKNFLSFQKVIKILHKVAIKEGIKHVPEKFAGKIANNANGNLRRALLLFESCKVQK